MFGVVQRKLELDHRTISGYFIGYLERSKGFRFYCPTYTTKIVESGNARFLESEDISGSNAPRNVVFEENRIPFQVLIEKG